MITQASTEGFPRSQWDIAWNDLEVLSKSMQEKAAIELAPATLMALANALSNNFIKLKTVFTPSDIKRYHLDC